MAGFLTSCNRWLLISLVGWLFLTPVEAAPVIETAQHSGVVGYEVGIFGSGFGDSQGSSGVQLGNQNMPIVEWRDRMIRATIPQVSAGQYTLTVQVGTATVSWPITIYTINPSFTTRVQELSQVSIGKPVYFLEDKISGEWGNGYMGSSPSLTLSRNDKTYPAYLDSSAGQIFAINLGRSFNEDVWFTMFGGTDGWPPFDGGGRAMVYTIEGSRNSTNGVDGSWDILFSESHNERVTITHKVHLNGQSWIRMKVAETLNNGAFRVNEIRVYANAGIVTSGRTDSFGIMGDSLTYADFGGLEEASYFPAIVARKRGVSTRLLDYPVGLIAAQADQLSSTNTEEHAFPRTLQQVPYVHVWGMAFGTNDSLSEWSTNMYKQNVREGIEQVLARGDVPIIARLADTGPEGYGTEIYKMKILESIDALNAEYRLIPGPDLFTAFRKNIWYEGMTYLNEDQTHHSGEGGAKVLDLWSETLIRSGIYAGNATPPLQGDLTLDGVVDYRDIFQWVRWFDHDSRDDVLPDSKVNIFDLNSLMRLL